jgi:transcriptional regulator with XRE-family HTH domain
MGHHRNFIRHWRKYRNLTQAQVVDKLEQFRDRSTSSERIAITEASLSRIEAGTQNFSMAVLAALAEILEADQPGELLVTNPFAGTLSVMRALDGLSPVQQDAALKVIEAMREGMNTPDPDPPPAKS